MSIDLKKIPRKRRRIVQYILDHPEQVVINGSEALSKKLSVDRSTLINACKDLGFSGFKDYRNNIKVRLKTLEHKTYPDILGDFKTSNAVEESIVSSISADLSALQITSKKVDLELIEETVDIIFNSNIVYICALGYNQVLGLYLQHLLRTIKAGIIHISHYHGEVFDAINNLTDKDVVISFSFDNVMSDSEKIFLAAKKKGAKTISFTDSVHSSISKGANVNLLVNNPSRYFFSPNVAALSLCNIIMHCAVEKNKPHSIKKLETYTKMSEKSRVFI